VSIRRTAVTLLPAAAIAFGLWSPAMAQTANPLPAGHLLITRALLYMQQEGSVRATLVSAGVNPEGIHTRVHAVTDFSFRWNRSYEVATVSSIALRGTATTTTVQRQVSALDHGHGASRIDHRAWVCQNNPGLAVSPDRLIGFSNYPRGNETTTGAGTYRGVAVWYVHAEQSWPSPDGRRVQVLLKLTVAQNNGRLMEQFVRSHTSGTTPTNDGIATWRYSGYGETIVPGLPAACQE
jgi:hypothetical protein